MIDTLNELKKKVFVGFVGGSDYSKVHEQLGESTFIKNNYWNSFSFFSG